MACAPFRGSSLFTLRASPSEPQPPSLDQRIAEQAASALKRPRPCNSHVASAWWALCLSSSCKALPSRMTLRLRLMCGSSLAMYHRRRTSARCAPFSTRALVVCFWQGHHHLVPVAAIAFIHLTLMAIATLTSHRCCCRRPHCRHRCRHRCCLRCRLRCRPVCRPRCRLRCRSRAALAASATPAMPSLWLPVRFVCSPLCRPHLAHDPCHHIAARTSHRPAFAPYQYDLTSVGFRARLSFCVV